MRAASYPTPCQAQTAAPGRTGPWPDLPSRRGRRLAELAGVLWTAGFIMAPTNANRAPQQRALLDWAYG